MSGAVAHQFLGVLHRVRQLPGLVLHVRPVAVGVQRGDIALVHRTDQESLGVEREEGRGHGAGVAAVTVGETLPVVVEIVGAGGGEGGADRVPRPGRFVAECPERDPAAVLGREAAPLADRRLVEVPDLVRLGATTSGSRPAPVRSGSTCR